MMESDLALPKPRESVEAPLSMGATGNARLRAMFQDNFAFIWRVLRRFGVPLAAVDDAAQNVFFVATRRVHEIAPESERAFLFGTALRIAAEARRERASNREAGDDRLDAEVDPAGDPEQLTERKHALETLDAVLEAMPLDLRTVFVLFELEGLSTHDIAPLLEIPRGTVASRLRRAREEFHSIAKRIRAKAAFRGGKS